MVKEIKDEFNHPARQWVPGCSCLELFVCGKRVVCETRAVLPTPPKPGCCEVVALGHWAENLCLMAILRMPVLNMYLRAS